MEAPVLLMKRKTVLPALANRHGEEKRANEVNLNGSETDGVSDKKRAQTNNLLLRRKSQCSVHSVYSPVVVVSARIHRRTLPFNLSLFLSLFFLLHYILRERFRPKLIE